MNLANATGNATIADGQAIGTIVNDDRKRATHQRTLGKALNYKEGKRLAARVPSRRSPPRSQSMRLR